MFCTGGSYDILVFRIYFEYLYEHDTWVRIRSLRGSYPIAFYSTLIGVRLVCIDLQNLICLSACIASGINLLVRKLLRLRSVLFIRCLNSHRIFYY